MEQQLNISDLFNQNNENEDLNDFQKDQEKQSGNNSYLKQIMNYSKMMGIDLNSLGIDLNQEPEMIIKQLLQNFGVQNIEEQLKKGNAQDLIKNLIWKFTGFGGNSGGNNKNNKKGGNGKKKQQKKRKEESEDESQESQGNQVSQVTVSDYLEETYSSQSEVSEVSQKQKNDKKKNQGSNKRSDKQSQRSQKNQVGNGARRVESEDNINRNAIKSLQNQEKKENQESDYQEENQSQYSENNERQMQKKQVLEILGDLLKILNKIID